MVTGVKRYETVKLQCGRSFDERKTSKQIATEASTETLQCGRSFDERKTAKDNRVPCLIRRFNVAAHLMSGRHRLPNT